MTVDGGVVGEFGVEGGGEEMVSLDEGGGAIEFGENGDARSDTFDDGAADEDHFERVFFQRAGTEENVAGELATVRIAEDGHIE